jgi:hypothetical protein
MNASAAIASRPPGRARLRARASATIWAGGGGATPRSAAQAVTDS